VTGQITSGTVAAATQGPVGELASNHTPFSHP